jgi:putative transposase
VANVIDDFSREGRSSVFDTSIGRAPVARELGRIAEVCGHPCLVFSDTGAEPASNAILK